MNSKLIPNTFQHPNAYIDWLSYYLTPEEEKVLNKAIREILGWHNRIESRQARIALSIFEHGKIGKETGEQLCLGCGLGIAAIRKALAALDKYKILVKVGDPTNDGQMYRIQDNYQQVDLEGLKARRAEQDIKNADRTSKARGVLSHITPIVGQQAWGIVPHNPRGIVGQQERNPIETPKETKILSPQNGEKTPQQEIAEFHGSSPIPETPPPEIDKETYLEQMRQAAGGDPVAGMLFAAKTAQDKAWTVPANAGGADPWERVADAFCCLHGLRLSDMPPKKRDQWPRKLEKVAALARASPAQMIEAIRAIPDSDYAFKVSGAYSTPYARSFENDIIMLVAQITNGQDVKTKKGNGSNGRYPKKEPETVSLATGFKDFPDH